MRVRYAVVLVALLPWLVSAAGPAREPVEVYFSPGGGCTAAVVRAIDAATQTLRIQAYSFTSTPIAEALIAAQKRGVKVEALLDKSNRTNRYSAGTFLNNQGARVLIDDKHAIAHNKIMIIDDAVIITGSFNFTQAAEQSNAENLLIIRDQPAVAQKYLANFATHRAHSVPFTAQSGGATTSGTQDEPNEIAPDAEFVGSRDSDVYHYANCADVRKIKAANLVKYRAAPAGKRLHKGCPN
jgi:phosphatidylserine/phosphatidylglycerophosphate/cardiolipin synthase-like enzyme